jgi:ABC-type nitrate/sulfonate/bicarbonate transport system ATPase subunit
VKFGARRSSAAPETGEAAAPGRVAPTVISVRDRTRGDLDVLEGETAVLLGPSGCGKSTWLRSLLALGEPFDRTMMMGSLADRRALGASVGWVPQTDGVFLSRTVWENVASPDQAGATDKRHAADALDWVGLSHRGADPVSRLPRSGRRRVALARAVARRRPLLIIDGELDPTLWPHFPALCEQVPWLRAVLVATSTVDALTWGADRVIPVDDGRVLRSGPMPLLLEDRDPSVRAVLAWTTP